MNGHTVKRAIILAAGVGERLRPVTLSTPKPLVMVNGVRIIDTIVSALKDNGIDEIYVVVGYKKEQFYEWVKEWSGIVIIENPYYDSCNNISSLYVVRDHLTECIILDGDQMIYNPEVLDSHFTISGYNAVWVDDETQEWLMKVRDGRVLGCSRTGGREGWRLYSISRWSKMDGIQLKGHVEMEFESGNRLIYWDDVVMFYYFNSYELGIRKMQKDDVVEIDSVYELAAIDDSYRVFLAD